MPKVSYIVASFNHEEYIEELLRSILAQAFNDVEIVVVDDGSTDGTLAIARRVAGEDARVEVHEQENRGVVNARNRGIESSSGEYVSIVDSDDLLPPDRTTRQVEALDARPEASMVWGDAWIVDEKGNRLGRFFENYPPVQGDFSTELFANYCFVPAISVMFRRSALEKTGPLWGPGPNTDYLKWIELGLVGDAVRLADPPLGCWRWHEANVSRGDAAGRVAQYAAQRKGLAELIRRRPELADRLGPRRINRRYARCHFMAGFQAGLQGAWPLARGEFIEAVRLSPSIVHCGGWASSLPGINLLSGSIYRAVARRKLKIGS